MARFIQRHPRGERAGPGMRDDNDWPDAEFFERQREISDPVFASEDAREGATAFAERRDPVWKGH